MTAKSDFEDPPKTPKNKSSTSKQTCLYEAPFARYLKFKFEKSPKIWLSSRKWRRCKKIANECTPQTQNAPPKLFSPSSQAKTFVDSALKVWHSDSIFSRATNFYLWHDVLGSRGKKLKKISRELSQIAPKCIVTKLKPLKCRCQKWSSDPKSTKPFPI